MQSGLRERVKRYAALRGAQRALVTAAPLPKDYPAAERAQELLRTLEEGPEAEPPAGGLPSGDACEASGPELERLDAALASYAEELLESVDAVSGPQLRATLPQTIRSERLAVACLLDLCLEAREGPFERLHRIDYLVTLLASEDREGERCLALDPTQVSLGMRHRCAEARGRANPAAVAMAQSFVTLGEELGAAEEVSPLIDRGRALKKRVGESYFHPALLRGVVAYNIAVHNRLERIAASKRGEDLAFYGSLGFSESLELDPEPAPLETLETLETPEAPEAGPSSSSALEAEGLGAIEEALRARLCEAPAADSPAALVAEAAELSSLRRWERQAFEDAGSSATAALVRRCVALGLTLRSLDELGEPLARLAIDTEELRGSWARQLDAKLQAVTQECVAAGDYEGARQLSQTRTDFLYESMAASIRDRKAAHPDAARAPDDSTAEQAAEILDEVAPEQVKARARKRRRLQLGWGAATLALAVMGLCVWMQLLRVSPGAMQSYTPEQLAAISPHLASAYRDGHGSGSLFVARVAQGWPDLDEGTRIEAAEAIAAHVGEEGMVEGLVFDDLQRLQVHLQGASVAFLSRH